MKSTSLSARSHCDAAVLASLSLTISLHAIDINKANNTDNLNAGTSWSGGTAPGTSDVGVWDSTVTGANNISLGGALSWSGIRIANPGGTVTINAGDSLTLGSAGIDMSAATQNLTLGNAVTLGAAQAWNVGTGRTLTTTGALGGSAALTKSGAGMLILSGANSSTGAVAVSAGTLKAGAANALGSITPVAGTSITAGATLDLGGFAQTTGSLSGAGIVTSSAAAGSLTLGGDNATANFTGTLNSANITTVNKTGTGTQTLTGTGFWATANTTSQYNILDGTLTIDATGVTSAAQILASGWAVSPGKTFNLNYNTGGSTLLFKTGALSGSGTVNLTGAGCIDFWASGTSSSLNGFTGQLNIGCSSLSIQTDTLAKATTTASVNISAGKFLDLRSQGFGCDKLTGTGIVADSHSAGGFGTLTVGTANGSSQFDGIIKDTDTSMIGYSAGGGIALTKTGTGTLTLTGATTYTGATTINDGTLVLSNAAGWASNVSFATSNSPKLQINTPLAADAWNFNKVISGANTNATFEKTGPGSVTITTSQTYTGATTVTAGALRLQSTEYTTAFPSIPGMKVWLDAADPEADGNTTSPTGGAAISTWKNKGTLGASGDFTAVQTGNAPTYTASVAAFNNKPTITFNAATGKQLANTTNFTNTVSVVYVGRIGATKQRLVSGNTVNWILGYWNGNMNANYWNGGSLGTAADINPHIWINGATGGANPLGYRFDAAGETLLGNGSSTGPTAGLMLGGGWAGAEKSDGDIAELFVFDHQLTTAERVQLEGYLYNKYFGSQFPTGVTSIASSSPVSVANGATFGGFGSAGNIAVSGGGTLEGGNSGAGTLTANNVTTSGTTTFKGSLSTAPGSRALAVTNLAINGGDQSLLINPSGTGLTSGTYDLLVSANPITAPGATSVQAALKPASRLFTPVLDGTGTKIQVVYDPNASVYWTGAASSAWNTSATNWKLSGNNADTQFQGNDVVYFHDSPATSVVDISGADVSPMSVTFDNTGATSYTLQGSNGISAGTITKLNGGTLNITNVNNTTGAVALNGGTVSLSQSGGLGTGNLSFDGGSLSYGGSNTTWTRNLGFNAGGGTLSVANAATTLTLSGAISGPGALTKSGAGAIALSNANSLSGLSGNLTVNAGGLLLSATSGYTGVAHIAGGTLQLAAANALVSTNNVVFDNNGANPTFYFNNPSNTIGTLTVGSNVTGAIVQTSQWSPTINGVTTLNSALTQKGLAGNGWNGVVFKQKITGNGAGAGNDSLILDANGQTAISAAFVWQYDGSAANDYVGNIRVKGGTTNAQALGGSFTPNNVTIPDAAMMTIETGSTFRWNNTGGIAVIETLDGLAGGGVYDRAGAGATSSLTINANNSANNGARVFSGNLASLASLTLGGTGMQEFVGVSPNFAFGTNLNNGTLRLTKTSSWNSDIVLGAADTPVLQLNALLANDSWTFGKVISGGSATATVEKIGAGTVTLSVGGTYTGTTTVNGGTLLITNPTGSGTGSGAVTVNASGTLGGTGSLSGTVTGAGTLAPGTAGTGTLTTGAVTLTGTYACQIDGANSDKLVVNGSLSLTGATLAISTISAPTAPSYVIATYTGTAPAFTTVTGLPAGYAVDTSTPGQIKVATPYASWASSKGLTEANGGKHDNPDGDGLDNLMEYAFGTDPLVSSGTPIAWSGATLTSPGSPTTSITNNGNSVDYRAVFGRRQDYLAAGLIYTVQFSADLSQWVNSSATPTVIATGTEVDAVSVPYPLFIPTTRGMEKPTFFRVSVTENP
jgi:fibronectin-binding autotransporter adhesin